MNPFVESGEAWRRGRLAVNPCLFNAKAAKSYMDGINKSASRAAKKIPSFEENFDEFCQLAAVDMFLSVALGVSQDATGSEEGSRTAKKSIGTLDLLSKVQMKSPWTEIEDSVLHGRNPKTDNHPLRIYANLSALKPRNSPKI